MFISPATFLSAANAALEQLRNCPRTTTVTQLEYGSNEGSARRLRPHLIRSSPKVLAVLGANCFTPSHPFGCLRLHSARASSSCAFHGSGVGLTRGPLKLRTVLPNWINSASAFCRDVRATVAVVPLLIRMRWSFAAILRQRWGVHSATNAVSSSQAWWPIRLFWAAQYPERTRAGLSLRRQSEGEALR